MTDALYLAPVDMTNAAAVGVAKKIRGQAEALSRLGFRVFYTGYCSGRVQVYGKDETVIGRYRGSIDRRLALYRGVHRWLRDHDISFCYVRYALCDPTLLALLLCMKRKGTKVVLEIPTYPYDDELSSGGMLMKLAGVVDRAFRKYVRNVADLVVTFSEHREIFGVPAERIENAIDMGSTRVHSSRRRPGELHLIAVASMREWHGYDRLIRGFDDYYGAREPGSTLVFLHLVGDGPCLPAWLALAESAGLQDYIYSHGVTGGVELDDLFDQSDMAVGSLGMSRIGLQSGSTLKLREYFARGIPFLYACEEEVMLRNRAEADAFSVIFDNDESPIDVRRVISFWNRVDDPTSLSMRMRAFAECHFDWEAEMRKVVERLAMSASK